MAAPNQVQGQTYWLAMVHSQRPYVLRSIKRQSWRSGYQDPKQNHKYTSLSADICSCISSDSFARLMSRMSHIGRRLQYLPSRSLLQAAPCATIQLSQGQKQKATGPAADDYPDILQSSRHEHDLVIVSVPGTAAVSHERRRSRSTSCSEYVRERQEQTKHAAAAVPYMY